MTDKTLTLRPLLSMHFRPPPQAAGLVSICLRRCTKRFDAWQFCHGMLVIQASKSERSIVSVAGKEGEGFKHAKAAPVRRFSQVFYLGARFSNLSFPAGVSRCCLRHGGLRRVFFRLILSYCTKTLEVGLWIIAHRISKFTFYNSYIRVEALRATCLRRASLTTRVC